MNDQGSKCPLCRPSSGLSRSTGYGRRERIETWARVGHCFDVLSVAGAGLSVLT